LINKSDEESYFFPLYKIKEVNNIKIAIVGIVSSDTLTLIDNNVLSNIKIVNHIDCLNKLIPLLNKQADIVVLLSHCGLEEDKRIAKQIEGINIIVSGHSQNLLFQPLKIGSTLIVQAGKNGSYVGKLDLEVVKTNKRIKIDKYKNKLVLLDKNVFVDKMVQEIINEYNYKIKKQAEKLLLK